MTSNPSRSGHYVKQPTGYSAFVPAPLPPEPPIDIGKDLQVLLSQADRALGRLDGSIETLPEPDIFVYMYVRKEAVLSSQIEGTQSSLQDLLAAEASVLSPDDSKDVNEVVNYVSAMNLGLSLLGKLPISVRLFKKIHYALLKDGRGGNLTPGELRTSQNWVGPAGSTINDAIFVPPPPQEVQEHLSNLEIFLHQDVGLPLLIKIGVAHAQFETIHPFLDGNGRIGRLLITFLLCEQKVLTQPVLYLSHYFKQHRQAYYENLQSVRDNGAWEKWLEFFLRGVIEVSGQSTETAKRILRLREEHRGIIARQLRGGAGNGHLVLEHLYRHPIVSVRNVEELIRTTYPSANDLVARLVECDILRETTGQTRNRRFAYQSYINLFQDVDR